MGVGDAGVDVDDVKPFVLPVAPVAGAADSASMASFMPIWATIVPPIPVKKNIIKTKTPDILPFDTCSIAIEYRYIQ